MRACLCPTRAVRALDYDLGLRVPQIMSRGAEGKGYGRGRGRMCLHVYLNVRI